MELTQKRAKEAGLFVAMLLLSPCNYSSTDTLQLNEKPSTHTPSTSKLKTFYRLVNLQLR